MRNQLTLICVTALALPAFSQDMTDAKFVDNAAQIHMTEAHLGKLAQQKGHSQNVKQYGQKLEADHKAGYQQLTRLNAGFNVPNAIDDEHNKVVQRFENLSGETFDRQFREVMIADHQKAIDLFERAEDHAKNTALRNYATQQLPILLVHLNQAKDLGGSVTSQQMTTPSTSSHPGSSDAQSRSRMADNNARTEYGTVTRYEAGKTIELKIRDRIGRHVYDLSEGHKDTSIPSDVRVGSQVVVTEMIDKNGQRTVEIRNDSAAAATEKQTR